MNNESKYLPLGSVVLLKEAKKKIMVIGFIASANETGDKVYDYMGCIYPEGVLNSDQTLLFNHDQIEKIYSVGYSDEEEKDFKIKLNVLNIEKKDSNNNSNVDIPILAQQQSDNNQQIETFNIEE